MYSNLLLPIDLNEESSWRKALPVAVKCCDAFGAKLHVMTVMPDLGLSLVANYFPADFQEKAHAELERQLDAFVREQVPGAVRGRHEVADGGTVYQQVLAAAGRVQADLIVMAAYRPDLKDWLLGPNAERVLRHAAQSVLVVRD